MKKSITAIVSGIAATTVALSLCACSEQPKVDQVNNLKLTQAYQTADASVYVTADVSKQYFAVDPNEQGYCYDVCASIDGGTTWSPTIMQLTAPTSAVVEIPVLYYNYDFNAFTLGDNSGNENAKVDVKAGDEINIALRFAETDSVNASAATESVKLTLKSPSIYGGDQTKVDYISIEHDDIRGGGISFENIFVHEQNGNYRLKKQVYDEDGITIITEELDASLSDAFEYKFFTPTDESGNNEHKVYYGFEENLTMNNMGWTNYNAQTGISAALCNAHKIYEYLDTKTIDPDGNVIENFRQKRLVAPILVRLKETPTAVRSMVTPVYLLITDWERVD